MGVLLPGLTLSAGAAGYVVLVSETTWSDPAWQAVVAQLQTKHSASVLRYGGAPYPEATRRALSAMAPDYVCVVAQPAEVTRSLVENSHRMLRDLDGDRYTDAIWGIVTGYDAAYALRLASHRGPLEVQNALLKTAGDWLEYLYAGEYHAEMEPHALWTRTAGGPIVRGLDARTDDTPWFAQKLNAQGVDLLVSSGHANEYHWQLHYPEAYPEGYFTAYQGQLMAQDAQGGLHPIVSTNAKIYYAPGNCLIGLIPEGSNRDYSMALAWLGSGGAAQMAAYVADTWFGYMGWGVAEYFIKAQGRFTFAESCYLINQALLFDAAQQTPGLDPAGLAYDRDVFVLYGDPAYVARVRAVTLPDYQQTLTGFTNGGRMEYTLNIRLNRAVNVARPVIALLPRRIYQPTVEDNAGRPVEVVDNMALVQLWREGEPDLVAGQQWTLRFSGNLTNTIPPAVSEVQLAITARTYVGPACFLGVSPVDSRVFGAKWEMPMEGARILEFDPVTLDSRVVARFGTCHGDVVVASDGQRLFTPDYYYDNISMVDLRNTNRVLSQINPPPGSWPGRITITPDRSRVILSVGVDGRNYDMGNDGLAVYDIRDGAFDLVGWVPLNDEPHSLEHGCSPDGRFLYLLARPRQSSAMQLYEVRVEPPCGVVRQMSLPVNIACNFSGVVCHGNRVIFGDNFNRKIWEVNRETWTLTEHDVDFVAADMVLHPNGRYLFVHSPSAQSVIVLDAETLREVGRSERHGEETGDLEISADGRRLYLCWRYLIAMDIILPETGGTVQHAQDFAAAPGWTTSHPGSVVWDGAVGVLRGTLTNQQGTTAFVPLPEFNPNRSWHLEWELMVESCEYGAGLTFGFWDEAMNIVMPGSAAMEMGHMDCGRGFLLYGGGVGRNQCAPSWQEGLWYRCRLFYDAPHDRLALHVLERDTGTLVGFLDMQVEAFPPGMKRLGISRAHLAGTDGWGLGAARVTYRLDNLRLFQEPPPSPVGVSVAMVPSLAIQGVVGRRYQVEFTTDLQSNARWQVLTNLTLSTTPQVLMDASGVGQPRRFYRVLPVE
ncbi:MAG: hypothetical protein N3J91_13860 [Verrucomicrobiae bacterium]|nr:hypothetical protein [Verrucomicrobiae bacterium]